MKHCQQCNLSFPDYYRFCGSCGAGLSDSTTCRTCGEMVESKWKFCTGCGSAIVSPEPVQPATTAVMAARESVGAAASKSGPATGIPFQRESKISSTREWYAAPELLEETDETTASSIRAPEVVITPQPLPARVMSLPRDDHSHSSRNGREIPTLTMLSAYGDSSDPVTRSETPSRYPVLLGLVMVLFFAMLGFGGWYFWTHRAAASPTNTDSSSAPNQSAMSNGFSAASAGETPAERAITADSVDNEWKRLREQRINAQPAERATIIAALEQAEKKYANDYRFPYERAKLSIKGITSHDEAFSALSAAGEKAIDNGKAQEMLDDLNADKDGDFYKLARGHHEWHALLDALESKDKSELAHLHH